MSSAADDKRKKAKRGVIFGPVIVAVSLGILLYNARWIAGALTGPVPITLAELRKLEDPSALRNPWITLAHGPAVETGMGIFSMSLGQKIPKLKYILIPVQDRWLIAEVYPSYSGNEISGYLWTWGSPLSKKAINEIKERFPSHPTLPYQFDATYNYRFQCLAMVTLVGLLGAFGAAVAVQGRAVLRQKPKRSGRPARGSWG